MENGMFHIYTCIKMNQLQTKFQVHCINIDSKYHRNFYNNNTMFCKINPEFISKSEYFQDTQYIVCLFSGYCASMFFFSNFYYSICAFEFNDKEECSCCF